MDSRTIKKELILAMTISCFAQPKSLIAVERQSKNDSNENRIASEKAAPIEPIKGPTKFDLSYLLALLQGELQDGSQPIP